MKIRLPALKKTVPRHFTGTVVKTVVVACAGVLPHAAWSQAEGGVAVRPTVSIVPRITVSEKYTNNVALQSTGKQSELITQVSPGISINSRTGRLRGTFDYSLNQYLYARNTSGRQSQNALSSAGVFEAWDNWAFIDFSGSISQQAISAFGTQANGGSAINANSTETSTYQLSPYFKGRLGGFADYVARYNWSTTRSADAVATNVTTKEASMALNGATGGSPLGWRAEANSQDFDYKQGRPITQDRFSGTLIYSFNPQINVSLTGGRESNNFTSVAKESHNNAGLGFNWAFSATTRLAAQIENRSFGRSHSLSFEHRTPRTAWKFSDSQNVAATPVTSGTTVIGSISELLFSQFESIETDPFKRSELVNRFLLDNGISSDAKVVSNFLTSSASLQRRQEISFALLGVRDTISFSLTRGSNSQLSNFVTSFDDLSNSSRVNQTGFSIIYSHRLTPDAALNVVAARQTNSGLTSAQNSSLRSIDVSVSGRVGRQLTASVGAHRAYFDNGTSPYNETAVSGSLSLQF